MARPSDPDRSEGLFSILDVVATTVSPPLCRDSGHICGIKGGTFGFCLVPIGEHRGQAERSRPRTGHGPHNVRRPAGGDLRPPDAAYWPPLLPRKDLHGEGPARLECRRRFCPDLASRKAMGEGRAKLAVRRQPEGTRRYDAGPDAAIAQLRAASSRSECSEE